MGNTVRDAINKALAEENYFPTFTTVAGAALGGLAGNRLYRKYGKLKRGDEVMTPAELVLVPAGAAAGLAYGNFAVERKKRAESLRDGNRRK